MNSFDEQPGTKDAFELLTEDELGRSFTRSIKMIANENKEFAQLLATKETNSPLTATTGALLPNLLHSDLFDIPLLVVSLSDNFEETAPFLLNGGPNILFNVTGEKRTPGLSWEDESTALFIEACDVSEIFEAAYARGRLLIAFTAGDTFAIQCCTIDDEYYDYFCLAINSTEIYEHNLKDEFSDYIKITVDYP